MKVKNINQIELDTKEEIKELENDIKNLKVFLKALGKSKNKKRNIGFTAIYPEVITYALKRPNLEIEKFSSGKNIFLKNK